MKNTFLLFKVILIYLSVCCISCTNDSGNEPKVISENVSLETAFRQTEYISNLTNLMIYKDGKLIKMTYDNRGGPYVPVDVRSITKSIMSLLTGIAIDKGFIKSVQQPITDFQIPVFDSIPQNLNKITIHHLLTMTSGFTSEEISSVYYYNHWFNAQNQIQYLLAQKPVHEPGEIFSYNSAAYHLLTLIIQNAAGMKLQNFAREYLFLPLGIEVKTWETDRQAFVNGSSGLSLSPIDMIKIGYLIINKGIYNGQRIVSEDWIKKATSSQVLTNHALPYGDSYGYGFWIGESEKRKYIFANGYGGQFIIILPDMNLVITATNYWYGIKYSMINYQWNATINLIMKNIVPAF